jgi:hypothetical protein
MELRRWLQKLPLVTFIATTLMAVSLISTATLSAQSTNRQIGTQFTVTADPVIPRPPEQPCIAPLFSRSCAPVRL